MRHACSPLTDLSDAIMQPGSSGEIAGIHRLEHSQNSQGYFLQNNMDLSNNAKAKDAT